LNHKKTLIFTALILGVMALPLYSRDINSSADAMVKSNLLDSSVEGKRIIAHPDLLAKGTSISSWHDEAMRTPSEGYVVFIDDMAYANFEHPCRYIFVDPRTGELIVRG